MSRSASSLVAKVVQGARRLFDLYAFGRRIDLDAQQHKAAFFWAAVCLITNTSLWGWMVFYLAYDAASLWPAAALIVMFQVSFAVPWIARRSRFAAELFSSAVVALLFSGLMWIFGAKSGLTYALLPAALILVMEIGTRRPGALLATVTPLLALFWLLPVWFPDPQPFSNATPWLLTTIQLANIGNLIVITLAMVIVILRRAENAEMALAKEYDRSETLLANLMPEQIAARLKDNPGEIIADENTAVTIVFADIVGFTPRAARMEPEALVAYLNSIFSCFDRLTEKHSLEKIKTIGDAYMAVAGMPTPRADHADAAAAFALDMLNSVDEISADVDEAVELRVGLHTGKAVGGVIGTTKVFYDVWGDTVNTAARLESHGETARIQVTSETRAALGDRYNFKRRGVIDIKGKGMTETYWLIGQVIE